MPPTKCAEALRLIASKSSAPSPLSSFFATRSTKSSITGMCTGGGVELCRLCSRPSCQYSSIEVSVVCMHSMIDRALRPVARVVEAEHLTRVSTSCLSQEAVACFCSPCWW